MLERLASGGYRAASCVAEPRTLPEAAVLWGSRERPARYLASFPVVADADVDLEGDPKGDCTAHFPDDHVFFRLDVRAGISKSSSSCIWSSMREGRFSR